MAIKDHIGYFHGITNEELYENIGEVFPKAADEGGKNVLAGYGATAQLQITRHFSPVTFKSLTCLSFEIEHAASVFIKNFTCAGGHHLPAKAIEEPHVQMRLQMTNVLAHSGLGKEASLSRS